MKKIIMIKDKRKRVVSNGSKLPCSGLYLLIMAVWYELISVWHVDSLMSKQNVKNTNIVTYNLHALFSL